MKPIFSLRNIRKCYDERMVLQCERLEFYPGRTYSLTGPNGAGKSTLLEILGLLQPPSMGVLEFKGSPIRWGSRDVAAGRRCVTLVQQTPYLLNGTVHDNIAFGLRLRGLKGRLQRGTIDRALKTVALERFENRRACELSGGEKQRVALARALALDPDVLLLDEPTSNICKDTTVVIEQAIAALAGQGKTVILSSHDPVQPQRLNSEVIRLHGGRVIEAPPVCNNVLPLPALPVIGKTACAGC